jgi:hypothetical protein
MTGAADSIVGPVETFCVTNALTCTSSQSSILLHLLCAFLVHNVLTLGFPGKSASHAIRPLQRLLGAQSRSLEYQNTLQLRWACWLHEVVAAYHGALLGRLASPSDTSFLLFLLFPSFLILLRMYLLLLSPVPS